MKRNRYPLFSVLLAFILFHSACAQNPGAAYLKEEKKVEQSTVLLNNGDYLVPLRNVGNLKIASIHFSNIYAAGFDSLLNKYAKVQLFNGSNNPDAKKMNSLSADLKLFNTLIIQTTEADLNNPQVIKLITDN